MTSLDFLNAAPNAKRAVYLTFAGLWARAILVAFWPFFALCFTGVGVILLQFWRDLGIEATWLAGLVGGGCFASAMIWGLWRFERPSLSDAVHLVDQTLHHRPLQVLRETGYIAGKDGQNVADLWQQHLNAMRQTANHATYRHSDINLAKFDPFGLSYVAILILMVGVLFGGGFAVKPVVSPQANAPSGGQYYWEGWVISPKYAQLPTLYLNDLVNQTRIEVLEGSEIQIWLYGQMGDNLVQETVSHRQDTAPVASAQTQSFIVHQPGEITITGDQSASWKIGFLIDAPPVIETNGQFETQFFGQSRLSYRADDDFGVDQVNAKIALDLARVNRRFGLSVVPDFDAEVEFNLPRPAAGSYRSFSDEWIEDHSKSVLAHMPVTITLAAIDAHGGVGQAQFAVAQLPARKFFDPLAAAIVEQRRDLLWSVENGPRVARMFRALTHNPDGSFRDQGDFLVLRTILRDLETAIDADALAERRADLADALWGLAISLEEGDVNDALEAMREAQERLSQAMRNGASEQEIERLMQDLRDANENYLRQLRQQAERDRANQDGMDMAQGPTPEGIDMTQADLQAMMDRVQELMEQGRMAEAQQALEELQQMMENMQISDRAERGQGQALDQLSDTLRDQQNLSDEAFQNLQNRSNPQSQPQDGQGQNDQSGDNEPSLADRQNALRDQLNSGRENLPDVSNEAGRQGRRALNNADQAMRRAEEAFRQGDLDQAIDEQAQAMDALREGIDNMDRAMAEANQQNPGQGNTPQDQAGNQQDPLGRPMGRDGQSGTAEANGGLNQDIAGQAQELLDEIRRRAGEQTRPDVERNYLQRLLDLF